MASRSALSKRTMTGQKSPASIIIQGKSVSPSRQPSASSPPYRNRILILSILSLGDARVVVLLIDRISRAKLVQTKPQPGRIDRGLSALRDVDAVIGDAFAQILIQLPKQRLPPIRLHHALGAHRPRIPSHDWAATLPISR